MWGERESTDALADGEREAGEVLEAEAGDYQRATSPCCSWAQSWRHFQEEKQQNQVCQVL